MISTILVPSDGSKTARQAAVYAVDLAKQLGASIIVLNVVDQRAFVANTISAGDSPRRTQEPVEDYLKEAAAEITSDVKKICDKKNVASKIVIRKGHPADVIVKEAKKSRADLIVMGSRGKSALSAAVLGSVSYGVIHSATKVNVLIVRD
jgi:nucleotide-binding universal stress UspA family protein